MAVDDGIIVESRSFYEGTQAIAISHEEIGIIRYGEILQIPDKFLGKIGEKVKAGDFNRQSRTGYQNQSDAAF